jgi:hypothetical protein
MSARYAAAWGPSALQRHSASRAFSTVPQLLNTLSE